MTAIDRKDFSFEVCANSVESCIEAERGGADRVELCASIPEGGITPSYGEIKQARSLLKKARLHVIIRPRGGDFLYSELELRRMEEDIDAAREIGADGVVFGCLKADGSVETSACSRLLRHAEGLSVTFHRAFDRCREPLKALEDIIRLGFNRILTSGQAATAEEGIGLLASLERQSAGRIAVMAGCGVNERNIRKIFLATGIHEYHFSAREPLKSPMQFRNPQVYMGARGADEDVILRTSSERVRNTIGALLNEG